MADRLNKIYTRSGDQGNTSLGNGTRLSKTSQRIETLGTIDELNACLGLAISTLPPASKVRQLLLTVQHQLFDLGGELAMADENYAVITQSEIDYLEENLDSQNSSLPPLKEFILPGGSTSVCHVHMARTICRRAERNMVALFQTADEFVNENGLIYLNRLSDLLFVISRAVAAENNEHEIYWQPKERR